jgi:UDP-N-acetylmuramoyl-L-alanyl-D-glutamate--2,6-diaminopimelate ligase
MLFKKMVDYGCKYAILEVTSHGIDQDRVGGINYEMGILTNISPEHLDYHKTFKNYQRVKSQLFLRSKVSILNRDDSSFDFINNEVKNNSKVISYGFKNKSDYFGTIGKNKKFCINIKTFEENKNININLPGEFNAYNCLAAIVAAKELNIGWKDISKSLRTLPQIKGRLEEVVNSKGFKIYIDFAHTSDSLENVLKLLRGMTEGNLILVFGCAGERDPLKRPKMGEISAKYADISIITSEDPRSEKVNTIISEIESGAKKLSVRVKNDDKFEKLKAKISGHIYFKIPERGEAIYFAIQKIARRGDIVVICGKGHEKSMSYSGVEYPWSDYEAVESALNGRAKIIIRS